MHKKSCERNGEYNKAEMTKRKLWDLRKQADLKEKYGLVNSYVSDLIHAQNNQQAELKAKYKEELRTVLNKWDEDKLTCYKEDVANQMFELRKRQLSELPTIQQIQRRSKSTLNHYSALIPELKKKQESLVSFGKYKEAHKLNKLMKKVKENDLERNNAILIDKLNHTSQCIQRKHSKEIAAMEMKIKRNWIVLWRQRQKNIEMVKKWYKNSKREIKQKYKQNWIKMEQRSPIIRMNIRDNICNFD